MGGGTGITWFEAKDWIGREITLNANLWRLTQKVSEREIIFADSAQPGVYDEADAHAVFRCESLNASKPEEAIMKIYQQIPAYHHFESVSTRALRATDVIGSTAPWETDILANLTKAGCTSAPKLLETKIGTQTWGNAWIPGGWVQYILMEKVPGRTPKDFFKEFHLKERDAIRSAFKEAWLDCANCGYVNDDEGFRNLVWDKQRSKCYIVDWEQGGPRRQTRVWTDWLWVSWGLASVYDGDLHDMTTWKL